MVQNDAPTPLYYQLQGHLREQIDSGHYQPGDKIPTESELTEQFGVSRTTVRRAVATLVNEGLLVKEQGRGTFVNRRKFTQNLFRVDSLTDIALRQGAELETRRVRLDETEATPSMAQALGIEAGAALTVIERVRLADGVETIMHKAYYPASLFPDLPQRADSDTSIYEIIEQDYGVALRRQEQQMEYTEASPREAGLLATEERAPLFLFRVTTYGAGGELERPVEFVKSLYRAELCQFVFEPRQGESGAAQAFREEEG